MTAAAFVVTIHTPGGVPPSTQAILKPRTMIGRVNGDILLQDPLCSSTHAELLLEGATLRLRDLGSTNGTKHGQDRITEWLWQPGDVLEIASFKLELREIRTRAQAILPPVAEAPPAEVTAKPKGTTRRTLALRGAALVGLCGLALWGLTKAFGWELPDLPGGGSTILSETREATVQFVWYSGQPGANATGGRAPIH